MHNFKIAKLFMNDHDCHAMDKPIFGCQLLNKEILYSDHFNVKTSRFLIGLTFKNSPKNTVFIQNTKNICLLKEICYLTFKNEHFWLKIQQLRDNERILSFLGN